LRGQSSFLGRFQIVVRILTVTRGSTYSIRAFCVVFVATAALGFEATTPAVARGYFLRVDNGQPRTEAARDWGRHQPLRLAASKTYARRGSKAAGAPSARDAKRAEVKNPERPLFVVVSIADQRVSIYNHNGLVERSAISTGVAGHPTPKGIFTIIGRERFHRSNLYSGAPMPFMQRVTWSGIAMHLGVVPGHPASHGCIRLPAGFAVKLWGMTRIGERVVISPQDVTPTEFLHPLLPAPKMRVQTAADQAELAIGSPQASDVAAEPQLVNPHQYAEQLKVKAAAEAAAAVKIVKETSAAIIVSKQEATRAATELKAAEAAHGSAQATADAAAEAYEAAVAAASAKQKESVLVAQLEASEGDVSGEAEAGRLAKAYKEATAAKAAAAIAKMKVDAALADAVAKLEAAKTASAAKAAELADSIRRSNEANAASRAAADAEKEARLRMSPLSILVSKKDRRIYVRQGLTPLFDAPASVSDPETPLGSHLYIATAVEDDGASLKWSVVSMPTRRAAERGGRRRKTAAVTEQVGAPLKPQATSSSPAEALQRVEIAQDVRDRISERLWTGASLIVSDQPLSGETGNVGTDLTVKVR
jgi:lipoprotein-anchoring transpeptidase ErfK/SrfK